MIDALIMRREFIINIMTEDLSKKLGGTRKLKSRRNKHTKKRV